MDLNECMKLAIGEAGASLREGNHGFGAVIVKDGLVLAAAHDTGSTSHDPTAYAETIAIRLASQALSGSLAGCTLVATHEPCPMCAAAAIWSGVSEVVYGYSIAEAIRQGRRRIDLTCEEMFRRAGAAITIHAGVMADECAVLYRRDVREEIERLRGTSDEGLTALNADSTARRLRWFWENRDSFGFLRGEDVLDSGYRLLLHRFGITEREAPVVKKTDREIVFDSMNFCPTLEACRILGLDTRDVCRKLNESSTDALVKQVDGRLRFCRNYEMLRPHAAYCEEMIRIEGE